MGVYQDWKSFLDGMAEGDAGYFQAEYYDKEALLYQKVLTDYPSPVEGRFGELAEQYHFELRMFAGFLEGVNTSLVNPIVLEKLRVNSRIRLEIDPKKLYFNMLEAKATWLYQLPEWEGILSETEQKEIVKERNQSRQAFREKIDRNAPCPCGSGKKYKKCHGKIA